MSIPPQQRCQIDFSGHSACVYSQKKQEFLQCPPFPSWHSDCSSFWGAAEIENHIRARGTAAPQPLLPQMLKSVRFVTLSWLCLVALPPGLWKCLFPGFSLEKSPHSEVRDKIPATLQGKVERRGECHKKCFSPELVKILHENVELLESRQHEYGLKKKYKYFCSTSVEEPNMSIFRIFRKV